MYKENLQNLFKILQNDILSQLWEHVMISRRLGLGFAAEPLPFASCSQEIARVLKPKGRYLFLEHIHAPKGCALHWQQKALKGKFGVASAG